MWNRKDEDFCHNVMSLKARRQRVELRLMVTKGFLFFVLMPFPLGLVVVPSGKNICTCGSSHVAMCRS